MIIYTSSSYLNYINYKCSDRIWAIHKQIYNFFFLTNFHICITYKFMQFKTTVKIYIIKILLTIAERNCRSNSLTSSVSMSADAAHSSLNTSSSTPSSYRNLEAIIYKTETKIIQIKILSRIEKTHLVHKFIALQWTGLAVFWLDKFINHIFYYNF